MMIPKKVIFCGVALSLQTAGIIPVRADDCANLRAQMTIVFAAEDRAEAEEGRVGRIKPPVRTDTALCTAENKVIQEGHRGQFATDKKCFDTQAKYNEFKTSLDSLINRHSKIAGLYHCPH